MTEPTPTLKVAPAALIERGVILFPVDITDPYTMWFGDGSSRPGDREPMRYTYRAPGDYMAAAKRGDTTLATVQIRVRNGLEPNVTIAPAPDSPSWIEVTFADEPAELVSEYEITWEPGVTELVVAPKGTTRSRAFPDGVHPIMVRDLHTGRAVSREVTVAPREYDPDITIEKGADAQTAVVTLTRLVSAGKDVRVDFGDGYTETIKAAQLNATATHTYATAAGSTDYAVEVNYSDGSTPGVARLVTIPFPAADETP